jgi:large subunit ribosomal protein L31e
MSQELERVYTINLGKVLLSPDNQRAKRAINMVKEFARHHMKTQDIKIEEDLSHQIWKRGIKHPPRKIRVKMTKTDEGFILVSPYEEEVEKVTQPTEEKKTIEAKEKPEVKIKEVKPTETKKEEPTPKDTTTKESKAKEPKAKETKAKTKESKPKESKKAESKKTKPKKKSK